MFPLGEIYQRTRNLSHSHAFPLFRNEEEIKNIYAMSSSITTIDKNIIHAVVSIPLINYNNRFEFTDIDISEEEIEILHNLSKLARQPIDHILCGRLDQLKVLSTSKLNRCLRTHNAKIFFCNERQITKKLVKDPDEISVLGSMEFDWKETSFDLEFLAVNSQF